MRRASPLLALLLVAALASSVSASEISVRAAVAPDRTQVGQSVALTITVEGASSAEAPSLTNLDGFDARYVGPSSQMSYSQGRVSSSITHRYALVPTREGVFTLGPFSVVYDGKNYETNTVRVAVSTAVDRATSGAVGGNRGDNLRLQLAARAGDVYLRERLPIEVTLYVKSSQVQDINFPALSVEGLSIEAFPQPERSAESFEGSRYEVLRFRTTALPLQAGARTLGPATLRLSVVTQGGGFFAQKRPVDLQSNVVDINVLPLPDEGRPPSFAGAVGRFTMEVVASPTDLAVGDPVTLRMVLRGEGSLTDTQPPRLSSSEGFRAYDPQATKESAPTERIFEQVLIPQSEQVTAVPPVQFSFFDTAAGAYQTLSSPPIALRVGARANDEPKIIAAPGQAPVEAPESLGQDIVYIKDDPGKFRPRDEPWFGSYFLLWWLPFPLAGFLAAVGFDRRRERLSGDIRYARFARASKEARGGLEAAERELSAGHADAAHDIVARTVREYLAAKLDLPVGAVDRDAVAAAGIESPDLEEIQRFFESAEHARYTGRVTASDTQALLAQAKQIVAGLDRRRKLRRR